MKKKWIILIVTIVILIIIGQINNENKNPIIVTQSKPASWRLPETSEFVKFGRLMINNGIKGCGEYHLKVVGSNEYIIACTKNGKDWVYYVAWPKINKIYYASDKMKKDLKAPR